MFRIFFLLAPLAYIDYYFVLATSGRRGGKWSPFLPILLVTGFYFSSIFLLLSMLILVEAGRSIEPVCLMGTLFLFCWVAELVGLATEAAFLLLAKNVETGS